MDGAPDVWGTPAPGAGSGPRRQRFPTKVYGRPVPERLGPYQIHEELGRGAQARVYRATHLTLQRPGAVKVITAGFGTTPRFVERFHREAHLAAMMNHPNIVGVYDSGEDDGFLWMGMELIGGPSCRDVLDRDGPIEPARAFDIARQVALALDHAAGHNVLHRDIKPENILLAPDGTAKLADLGLAKRDGDPGKASTKGKAVGTASYVAPEAVSSKKTADIRADIYSLGLVLIELITGAVPLQKTSVAETIIAHVHEDCPKLSTLATATISRDADLVVGIMTRRKRDGRYPKPKLLADDLEALRDATAPPHATAKLTEARTRRRARNVELGRESSAGLESTVLMKAVVMDTAGEIEIVEVSDDDADSPQARNASKRVARGRTQRIRVGAPPQSARAPGTSLAPIAAIGLLIVATAIGGAALAWLLVGG